MNSPFAGFAARVVRARGGLRAVRREGGGGDRHASPSGEPVLLHVPVWAIVGSGAEVNPVCVAGRGERAEHRKIQQHG